MADQIQGGSPNPIPIPIQNHDQAPAANQDQLGFEIYQRGLYIQAAQLTGGDYTVAIPIIPNNPSGFRATVPGWLHALVVHHIGAAQGDNPRHATTLDDLVDPPTLQRTLATQHGLNVTIPVIVALLLEFTRLPVNLQTAWRTTPFFPPSPEHIDARYLVDEEAQALSRLESRRQSLLLTADSNHRVSPPPSPSLSLADRRSSLRDRLGRPSALADRRVNGSAASRRSASPDRSDMPAPVRQRTPLPRTHSHSDLDLAVQDSAFDSALFVPVPDRDRDISDILADTGLNTRADLPGTRMILQDRNLRVFLPGMRGHRDPLSPGPLFGDDNHDDDDADGWNFAQPTLARSDDFLNIRGTPDVTLDQVDLRLIFNSRAATIPQPQTQPQPQVIRRRRSIVFDPQASSQRSASPDLTSPPRRRRSTRDRRPSARLQDSQDSHSRPGSRRGSTQPPRASTPRTRRSASPDVNPQPVRRRSTRGSRGSRDQDSQGPVDSTNSTPAPVAAPVPAFAPTPAFAAFGTPLQAFGAPLPALGVPLPGVSRRDVRGQLRPPPPIRQVLQPQTPATTAGVTTNQQNAYAQHVPGVDLNPGGPVIIPTATSLGNQPTLPPNATPAQIALYLSLWAPGRHIPESIPGRVFACDVQGCGHRTETKRNFARHVRRMHGRVLTRDEQNQRLPVPARRVTRNRWVLTDAQGNDLPGEDSRGNGGRSTLRQTNPSTQDDGHSDDEDEEG